MAKVESFVDPARFAGTCYRAANWLSLGLTSGYARQPGAAPRWRRHGQPKEILVYELQPNAARTLRQPEEDPAWQGPPLGAPPDAPRLRSLFECLGSVPEYRHARGKRYSLRSVLVLAVAARLAGYRGVTAFAQFAGLLSQEQRRAVECFYSPTRQCYTAPSITTFHNILATLPPDTLEEAIAKWVSQESAQVPQNEADTDLSKTTGEARKADRKPARKASRKAGRAARKAARKSRRRRRGKRGLRGVSMDGKDVRGASQQTANGRRMLVAAVEQGKGKVLGQLEVDSKTNEIPAVRELAVRLDLVGCVVTFDALHAQHETARCLREDCRAHYVITAIKDNQPTMREDLLGMDFDDCPMVETLGKEHGRIERRRYWVKDISAPEWDGYASLYGRRQAIRIERERHAVKTGKTSKEVSYALTSLGAEEASPEQLAALIRNHWHIENRVHYVRDFTYDEDRCRVYVRDLPRNLACLTNTAISIIRCQPQFRYVPQANRHFAKRTGEALALLLDPPG